MLILLIILFFIQLKELFENIRKLIYVYIQIALGSGKNEIKHGIKQGKTYEIPRPNKKLILLIGHLPPNLFNKKNTYIRVKNSLL